MENYINQSVAIAKITHLEVTKPNATLTDAKRVLAHMPTSDAIPVVYGWWMDIMLCKDGNHMIATCSHCKDRGDVRMEMTDLGLWKIDSPYCPNCGARMNRRQR